ncbi:type II secretion system protein GspL [Xanthomonas maliensis]|uniref:type II secretion system protein GspL n=1 Tax=Xanthomonas maliensis TaxID=1321368 RepID=UPI00039AC34B|nr:type II secretion system protein GspL [Xanthomonas maliensis]KAB7767854.1 type II secretion system protein GspL [Xanthomonas maliensis]
MTTLLLVLPADAAAPAIAAQVEAHGQLRSWQPCTTPLQAAARSVLVVPGVQVHLRYLRLPGRSRAQLLAAARLHVAEYLAADSQEALVSIAETLEDDGTRLVAVVAPATMAQWLTRAAALGVVPDAVVPDCLLLPAASDAGTPTLLAWDGRWLLRAPGLACSLEPDAMRQLLARQSTAWVEPLPDAAPDPVIAQFASQLAGLPIDLRPSGAARRTAPADGTLSPRAVWLLALLILSPLLLSLAQTLRYEIGAQVLQRRVAALRSTEHANPVAAPTGMTGSAAERFAAQLETVFAAAEAVPGIELDTLDYRQSAPLRVTVVHRDAAELEQLTTRLRSAGWQARAGDSQTREDGIATAMELEPVR